jgi:hypothetical protein
MLIIAFARFPSSSSSSASESSFSAPELGERCRADGLVRRISNRELVRTGCKFHKLDETSPVGVVGNWLEVLLLKKPHGRKFERIIADDLRKTLKECGFVENS